MDCYGSCLARVSYSCGTHNSPQLNSLGQNPIKLFKFESVEASEKALFENASILTKNISNPSTSEGSYPGVTTKLIPSARISSASGGRVSSESGYGTSTTARSSVSSEREKLFCKCQDVTENDDVFYNDDEKEETENEMF